MSNDAAQSSVHYTKYEIWKGWHKLFFYSSDQSDYYFGETCDLAIAGANVLEIGFGSGEFLQWSADQGARVAGCEINEMLLSAARENNFTLIDANIERIADQLAGHFDTIIAFDVFEHFTIEEIIARLRAVEIMLKPGGHLLLRFPNAQSPFGLAPQNGDPTHRTCLSRSVVEQWIQGSGLKVVRYGYPFRARGRSLGVILARLVRYSLRDMISKCLNFVYATRIPYDPVVVLTLRKEVRD